jgi:hypothetical protein
MQHPNGTTLDRRRTELAGVPAFPVECPEMPTVDPGYATNLEGVDMGVVIGWRFAVPIVNVIDGPVWYTNEFWREFECQFGDKLEDLVREHIDACEMPEWFAAMIEDAWAHAAEQMRGFGTQADVKQRNEESRLHAEVGRAQMRLKLAQDACRNAGVA